MRVHGVHRRGGDLGLYLSGKISSAELTEVRENLKQRGLSLGALWYPLTPRPPSVC